eukprot:6187436-Pleurochrysis_carterae.AAC.1
MCIRDSAEEEDEAGQLSWGSAREALAAKDHLGKLQRLAPLGANTPVRLFFRVSRSPHAFVEVGDALAGVGVGVPHHNMLVHLHANVEVVYVHDLGNNRLHADEQIET